MNLIAEQALARSLKLLEIPSMTPAAPALPKDNPESAPDYDSRTADKFVMRLPEGMRQQVAARARVERRSMNGLLVHATEQYMQGNEELEALLDSVKLLKRELKEALALAKSNLEVRP